MTKFGQHFIKNFGGAPTTAMFEDEDGYTAAVNYCLLILDDDVLRLKSLMSRIHRAPTLPRNYFRRHCRNVRELEEFCVNNSYAFFVENGRVARYRDDFELNRAQAIWYFKERLECYDKPVHFEKLKKDHMDAAPDEVGNFIARFYPVKDFKRFLRTRPDIFVVYPDNTVFLIETETVAFYERSLERYPEKNFPFLRLRGRLSQAPTHIQEYVNRYYPGDDFQVFLRNHQDVFVLDDDLNVNLVPFK